MTRDEKAQANAWLSILVAGLSLVIAAGGLAYYTMKSVDTQNQIARAQQCNTAYAFAQNKAQKARIPYLVAQSRATRTAFEQVPAALKLDPAAVQRLVSASEAVVKAADSYSKAQNLYPYPIDACPKVKMDE